MYQPLFDQFPSVVFNKGLPDIAQFDGKHRNLLLLDGMMTQVNDSVSDLFTRVAHHKDVSVIVTIIDIAYCYRAASSS